MAWRSYLKVCVIDGVHGARTAGYCVESPDRDFIPSRLVTQEPPRMKTPLTALPTRRVPTTPPPTAAVPTIPMSPSTARLMARPKAGRTR